MRGMKKTAKKKKPGMVVQEANKKFMKNG